jgi:hypothetical protein
MNSSLGNSGQEGCRLRAEKVGKILGLHKECSWIKELRPGWRGCATPIWRVSHAVMICERAAILSVGTGSAILLGLANCRTNG